MKTHLIFAAAIAALSVLAACAEKTQTIGSNSRVDSAAFQGPKTTFTAPGWTPGDKTSWEQELKTRLQMGQNEYAKVN